MFIFNIALIISLTLLSLTCSTNQQCLFLRVFSRYSSNHRGEFKEENNVNYNLLYFQIYLKYSLYLFSYWSSSASTFHPELFSSAQYILTSKSPHILLQLVKQANFKMRSTYRLYHLNAYLIFNIFTYIVVQRMGFLVKRAIWEQPGNWWLQTSSDWPCTHANETFSLHERI